MNCEIEDCDNQAEYEMGECNACEDCWLGYWRDNDIGLEVSFKDFKDYTLSLIKEKNNEW